MRKDIAALQMKSSDLDPFGDPEGEEDRFAWAEKSCSGFFLHFSDLNREKAQSICQDDQYKNAESDRAERWDVHLR